MEFAAGLILGSILGVVADRLFTYLVEKRVYVTISASFPGTVYRGDGLSINITNEGMESLPPTALRFTMGIEGHSRFSSMNRKRIVFRGKRMSLLFG